METIRVVLALALPLLALPAPGAEDGFTQDFDLEGCRFTDTGVNPYFSLEPGHTLVLEGTDDREPLRLRISVLADRQWIAFPGEDGGASGVRTRVIEEREWADDELVEVSRNYFALCQRTNDVYYFGEDVEIYEGGVVVSHDGSWRAGVDGARPGLIMPGTFLLGSRYYQELAPGVALDRAEHVAQGFEAVVRAGAFDSCVEIVETTPLEPRAESTKVYCAGVGLVADDEVELVEIDDSDRREAPRSGQWIR